MISPRFYATMVAAVSLSFGLTGCGGSSSPSPVPSVSADVPVTMRSTYGPLEFTLTLPKTTFNQNEPVTFVFSVRNISDDTVELTTSDDLARTIVTQNEKIIYSGSGSAIQVVRRVSLAAGQTVTYQTVSDQVANYRPGWPQRTFEGIVVPRGLYMFSAGLTAYDIQVADGAVVPYTFDERSNHLNPPAVPVMLQ